MGFLLEDSAPERASSLVVKLGFHGGSRTSLSDLSVSECGGGESMYGGQILGI